MQTILHLTSSIFGNGGQSSRLAKEFIAQFPGARVIARDLAKNPLPHLDAERFGAFLAKPEARTPAQQQAPGCGLRASPGRRRSAPRS